MAGERVRCQQCGGHGTVQGSACRKCGGSGWVNEYRLFDPKKPSSTRTLLRWVVVLAFVSLCASYCSNIRSKMDHQARKDAEPIGRVIL
jgi:ribosomal protein L40E